jgi:hypothetical protein
MTILKPELEKIDDLDKALQPLYTQQGGKYVFTGLEGYDPTAVSKLQGVADKERRNASEHANALKPWKTLFGDKKAEDVQAELDRIEEYKLAAKGKLDEGAIEERVTARLTSATKPFERKLTEAAEKLAKAEARTKAYEQAEERAAIRAAIQREARVSNALPEAYADDGGLTVLLEGQLKVEVEVTQDADGNPVRKLGKVVSRDGSTELPKLLQQVQSTQGYFWGTSKGGGAGSRGGNGNTAPVVKGNPWAKETRNRTEQQRLDRENPSLAAQYKREAGVSS